MGTRFIDPQPLIFDHAAQFFTVSDHRFSKLVDGWLEKRLVRQWQGTIGNLEVGGQFVPLPSSPPRYIGVNGMRPLADSLLSQVINPTCFFIDLCTYYSILCHDHEVEHVANFRPKFCRNGYLLNYFLDICQT